jgi:hypothetical protein
MTVRELKKKNNMPWNKDGSRKKSPFYLKSGNRASYSDLQVEKPSPVKAFPIIPAVIAAVKGLATKAGVTKLVGAAATGTASSAGGKAISGGKKKDTPSIISGEQKKIVDDEE